jgi:hypothetical protein
MRRPGIEFAALEGLHRCGRLPESLRPVYCEHLMERERYPDARRVAQEGLALLPQVKISGKRTLKQFYTDVVKMEATAIKLERVEARIREIAPTRARKHKVEPAAAADAAPPAAPEAPSPKPPPAPPPVPVSFEIAASDFLKCLEGGSPAAAEDYDLALEAHQIRLRETFDRLICLGRLKNVQSLSYQEETARKVLKRFRGRALLADEVGLGKTIEAATVLREYIDRGMVKSALILTPASLVGQWREELFDKFGLDFPSTDNPEKKAAAGDLWDEPFLIASINQAKSKKNYARAAVLDIWMKAADTEERRRFFAQLGSTVKRLKSGYEKSRALDEKLFGDSFEL